MLRRTAISLCLVAFCLSIGCGEDKNKNPNPDLEYSKEGPPKRGGVPNNPTAPKTNKKS